MWKAMPEKRRRRRSGGHYCQRFIICNRRSSYASQSTVYAREMAVDERTGICVERRDFEFLITSKIY
jgi:hypothetical protein